MENKFHVFAKWVSEVTGSAWAFALALLTIIVWGITGPIFGFSDTWQLVINTGTTIVTFLMVFLIQNTQNRDSKTINLKIDELIRSTKEARNSMLDLDDVPDKVLNRMSEEFKQMGAENGDSIEEVMNLVEQEMAERRGERRNHPEEAS
ncbi:MAG: low affinity iron permease family protein [Acidobacteriota bacterium]